MALQGAPWQNELAVAQAAALEAAAEILRFYELGSGSVTISMKREDSPVTDADLASDRIIRQRLHAAFPADAIMTEETADDPSRLTADRLWIVDPLDGTQQFIDRTGDFDVFIALVVAHRPVVAVVANPTTGIVLSAVIHQGATIDDGTGERPLRVPALSDAGSLRVGTNRYHTPPHKWPLFLETARIAGVEPPAEPVAFFPRAFFSIGDTPARYECYVGVGIDPEDPAAGGEWDVAAPDLILNEAGARFTTESGEFFRYNMPNRELRNGIVVAIDDDLQGRLVQALAAARTVS